MKEIELKSEAQLAEDAKKSFLDGFDDIYKDEFLPKTMSDSDKNKIIKLTDRDNTRKAIVTAIPMVCRAEACHPAGTLIDTRNGPIPIENCDGLHVRYWDANNDAIRGGFAGSNNKGMLASLSTRKYTGWMIDLFTDNDRKQSLTHDHISIVKWKKGISGFAIYLMRRGETWRIGKVKLFCGSNDNGRFGPIQRARSEDADAIWILDVLSNNTEALLREEYFSVKYGISKSCFMAQTHESRKWDGLYKWVTQEELDAHHKSLAQDEIHYRSMLQELGLCLDHPIWSRDPEKVGKCA